MSGHHIAEQRAVIDHIVPGELLSTTLRHPAQCQIRDHPRRIGEFRRSAWIQTLDNAARYKPWQADNGGGSVDLHSALRARIEETYRYSIPATPNVGYQRVGHPLGSAAASQLACEVAVALGPGHHG